MLTDIGVMAIPIPSMWHLLSLGTVSETDILTISLKDQSERYNEKMLILFLVCLYFDGHTQSGIVLHNLVSD